MRLVIDIPDEAYEQLKTAKFPLKDTCKLIDWITDGMILPQWHGRLIDADCLGREINFCIQESYAQNRAMYQIKENYIDRAPTVIEPVRKDAENE